MPLVSVQGLMFNLPEGHRCHSPLSAFFMLVTTEAELKKSPKYLMEGFEMSS